VASTDPAGFLKRSRGDAIPIRDGLYFEDLSAVFRQGRTRRPGFISPGIGEGEISAPGDSRLPSLVGSCRAGLCLRSRD